MKNLTLAGRLTKDAETRDVGGDRVTSFSIAVDDRGGREKKTIFFDCSMWGKRGEAVQPYLTKGASVTASGDLSTRENNGKTYLSVRVNDLTLQGGKAAGETRTGGGGSEPQPQHDDLGDIPFIRMAGVGDVG